MNKINQEQISEELEDAASKYAYELYHSIGVSNTEAELAFKAGAKWQKQNIIAKATAFLIKHRNFIAFSDTFIEDFGKCLEED